METKHTQYGKMYLHFIFIIWYLCWNRYQSCSKEGWISLNRRLNSRLLLLKWCCILSWCVIGVHAGCIYPLAMEPSKLAYLIPLHTIHLILSRLKLKLIKQKLIKLIKLKLIKLIKLKLINKNLLEKMERLSILGNRPHVEQFLTCTWSYNLSFQCFFSISLLGHNSISNFL